MTRVGTQANKKGTDSNSQIYARVKEAIIFNRLPPGRQINIHDLGERFGVSEIPARDALIRLAHEELIEHQPNKGYFTKPMTVKQFADHYEMAGALLRHATQVTTAAFTTDGLRVPLAFGGDNASGEAETIRSKALFIEGLFERIAVLSGNKVLVSAVRRFNDHTTFVRELDLEMSGRENEIRAATLGLIDALTKGQKEDAIANLNLQLARKREVLPDIVKEGNFRGWQVESER